MIDSAITQSYMEQLSEAELQSSYNEMTETLKCTFIDNGMDDEGVYNIYVIMYCLPTTLVIKKQLEDEFDGVFKNAGIKKIVSNLTDIWHSGNDGEFNVSGKKDTATRLYKFIAHPDYTKKMDDSKVQAYASQLSGINSRLKSSTNMLVANLTGPALTLVNQFGSKVLQKLVVDDLLAIVEGKVMMLDEIVQVLKTLRPVI